MEQALFCSSCGRKVLTVNDESDVAYLREKVEQAPRCECGAMPYRRGVVFE